MTEHGTLTDADFDRLRAPPRVTEDLPGIGGRLRARPEDFRVREIPAYDADGRPGAHLLLTMRKRGLSTEDAVRAVARALGIDRQGIGVAGLKDSDAVTEQRISLPFAAKDALDRARASAEDLATIAPGVELGPATPHGNKLRRGHLHGNEFELTIRDLAVAIEAAEARAQAKIERLAREGGLDNLFGAQRFGDGGRNILRGLQEIAGGRARDRRKADFIVSAGQSVLFNLYLLERRDRGLMRRVLVGDILRTARGGLFECRDAAADQARLDAGEIELTGPMFGGKMMAGAPGTPSADLEAAILDRAGVSASAIGAMGRKVPGTRRTLQLSPKNLQIRRVAALELASHAPDPHNPSRLGEGLCLCFALPAGAYATQLVHEIQGPHDPDPADADPPGSAGSAAT
ncbi:MAG: tRNA pseudouridine(13) synthase TruD [Nannocystaceae bacterium]